MTFELHDPFPQGCKTTFTPFVSGNRGAIRRAPLLARWHSWNGGRLECQWVPTPNSVEIRLS